ncbi:MAG: serine hydrolase domain-containing protein [Planctomycetota bacterium]
MSLDKLPKTKAVLEQGRSDGMHHGAQLCVLHRGKTVCDGAMGERRPGEPLKPQHLMLWLSAGKPLTAAAALKLCEPDWEGGAAMPALRLDEPIGRSLPEFLAGHDDPRRRQITVRHLLTHTAGLSEIDVGYPDVPWEESIRRLCNAPLADDWAVGRDGAYSPKAGWFLLGEIVRRAAAWQADDDDDEDWDDDEDEEDPVSAASNGASAPDLIDLTARLWGGRSVLDGRLAFQKEDLAIVRPQLAPMYRREKGELVDAGMQTDAHLTRISPGSSLRAPAKTVAGFYRRLLEHDGGAPGDAFLTGLSVDAMTARHRVGVRDRTFQHDVDFGLGVIVDSNRYGAETVPYGFGPHCSPRTFGHGGSQSTMAFGDPENELAVAWATNGMCGEPKHQRRNRAINAAIYEDLGLT